MAKNPWEERMKSRDISTPSRGAGPKGARGKEIMFKITSTQKTKAGVKAVANYIASHGGAKDKVAYDHKGDELDGEKINEELEKWNLLTNDENLSAKARDMQPHERMDLDIKDRYQHRQAYHMIISFPAKHHEVTDDQIHAFAVDYLEPFAEGRHKAMFAIHRHQGNPHVHILVNAREGENGPRLHFDKGSTRTAREWAAKVANKHGIECQATIRENSREKMERVQKGLEPFRDSKTAWQIQNEQDNQRTGKPLIERQVPTFYERHGARYEAERAGVKNKSPEMPKVELPELSAESNKYMKGRFADHFQDPEQARQAFLEMMAENRKTAFWYINNNPNVFGQAKPDLPEGHKLIVTSRNVKVTEAWRNEALGRIHAAQARVKDVERKGAKHDATVNRAKADAARDRQNKEFNAQRAAPFIDGVKPTVAPEQTKAPEPDKTYGQMSLGDSVKSLWDRMKGTTHPEQEKRDGGEQHKYAKTKGATLDKSATVTRRAQELSKGMAKGKGQDKGIDPQRGKGRERER